MAGLISYFGNTPDFGMDYLMMVPDDCVFFVMLMCCLMIIMSFRERQPGSEEFGDD